MDRRAKKEIMEIKVRMENTKCFLLDGEHLNTTPLKTNSKPSKCYKRSEPEIKAAQGNTKPAKAPKPYSPSFSSRRVGKMSKHNYICSIFIFLYDEAVGTSDCRVLVSTVYSNNKLTSEKPKKWD